MNRYLKKQEEPETNSNWKYIPCGMLMGVADSVPGVSGGTVAFVLGFYQRLISSISHFDRELLRLIAQKKWREAAIHIDLAFLIYLAVGIAIGFVTGVLTVANILKFELGKQYLNCAFIGMVLASAIIVWRMINTLESLHIVLRWTLIGIGVAIAGTIASLEPPASHDSEVALWYIFVVAGIAICAMILPGISGALLLMLFGLYKYLTLCADEFLHFENVGENLTIIMTFCCGAIIGLMSFTKVLRRLLKYFQAETLTVLMGLMLGSLVALWPFQTRNEELSEKLGKDVFRLALPETFSFHWIGMAFVAVFALVLVLQVERWSSDVNDESDTSS